MVVGVACSTPPYPKSTRARGKRVALAVGGIALIVVGSQLLP
jgi:hypothetical protein